MHDLLQKIQTLLCLLEKMDQNWRWLKFSVKPPTNNWAKDGTLQYTMLGYSLLSQTTLTQQPSSFCLEHCYYLLAVYWAHSLSVAVSRSCLHSWSPLQWKLLAEQRGRIGGDVAVFLPADPNLLGQRGERYLDIQLTITFTVAVVDPGINLGKKVF